MTARTPVERVAEILRGAGYRRVATPREIAGVKFELPMALVGNPPSPDLVVIADTAFEDERRILKTIEGVARALDVARSKRPLTAILAGPRPRSSVLDAMSRVCRVLPIGTVVADSDPDAVLRNWLAVLMPLRLPEPTAGIADPMNEIAGRLVGIDPELTELLSLAARGSDAVKNRLHELVSSRLGDEAAGDDL